MKEKRDEQIIAALKCCAVWGECANCPYNDVQYKSKEDNCTYRSAMDALDLIERQQAQIAALIAGQESLQRYIARLTQEKSEIFEELDEIFTFVIDTDVKFAAFDFEKLLEIKKKHTEGDGQN